MRANGLRFARAQHCNRGSVYPVGLEYKVKRKVDFIGIRVLSAGAMFSDRFSSSRPQYFQTRIERPGRSASHHSSANYCDIAKLPGDDRIMSDYVPAAKFLLPILASDCDEFGAGPVPRWEGGRDVGRRSKVT